MSESVPVILLEQWIHDLRSNLKQASEEAENTDYWRYQGMKDGVDKVGLTIATWIRHQKYLETLNRSGRKFLFVRRVNLSGGRYRNLEWYENGLFLTLAWRQAKDAPRGELMLHIQNVQHLTTTYLVYHGRLTFDDLVGIAREGGLKAVTNAGDWREWD